MCIASERLKEFKNYIYILKQDRTRLEKQLGKIDKERSQLYHIIENTYFNASRGYCLAKQLQTVLHKRRKIKEEIDTLNSLIMNLNNNLKTTDSNVNKIKAKIKTKRLTHRHAKIVFA